MGEAPALRNEIDTLADALLAVVLAPVCAACRQPLEHPTRGVVCPACWNAVIPIAPPRCVACGDPLPSWRTISVAESRCPRCRRRVSAITRAAAVGPYEGSLRAIVHALKYDGRRSVARPLGLLIRRHCPDLLAGIDIAVPVPLHRRRMRQRGFNQAAELANHLGVPISHALRRTRATPTQTSLPAARRHANVRDAFAPARRVDVRSQCVLLVDDVSTTGATLEACARVLRDAGAGEVRAVTAARVVSQPR